MGCHSAGINIKVFEPLAHRASASPVLLARMQNLLARNISDIQVIKQNDTPEIQIANLKYFHLPNRASGSQVLLAPPHFLLAPSKWAMLNVEPCSDKCVFTILSRQDTTIYLSVALYIHDLYKRTDDILSQWLDIFMTLGIHIQKVSNLYCL